jgi:hypothetical protein
MSIQVDQISSHMKTNIVLGTLILVSISAAAQENAFTLSGGYAFSNVEDVDANATGWRINGLYEFDPAGGPVSHGVSIGYIGTSAEYTLLSATTEYKINSWPIYYAPKFMFGSETTKGFIKGAIGMQFSWIKRTGSATEINDTDRGFYGGVAAGVMKTISDKVFINLEYEWAFMSNSFYRDGLMNSIMLGIGTKF